MEFNKAKQSNDFEKQAMNIGFAKTEASTAMRSSNSFRPKQLKGPPRPVTSAQTKTRDASIPKKPPTSMAQAGPDQRVPAVAAQTSTIQQMPIKPPQTMSGMPI